MTEPIDVKSFEEWKKNYSKPKWIYLHPSQVRYEWEEMMERELD